jgi:hypothetical protein
MAQLPHVKEAIVPRNKIENYLLNSEHPIGSGKAKFFTHFGFRREGWQVLVNALRKHPEGNPIANSMSDADGVISLVEGPLETPSGRLPRVRTVWLQETSALAPRFISAYPLRDDR